MNTTYALRSDLSRPAPRPVPSIRYISAQALADMALPGLPATRTGVVRRAGREGWPYIDRIGRGGGRLFAVDALPAVTRDALRQLQGGAPELVARRTGRPEGTGFMDRHPDVREAIEGLLAERRLSAPQVLALLQQRFAQLPSLRTIKREVARIEREQKVVLTSLRDPDRWKSKYRLALGRADGSVTHAHQVWELDTTKADVLTLGGRKMVLGLIDRWSRRARFLVVPSESGQSVRRLLVDTIRAWGVLPEAVATDNGSGFVNAGLVTALEALGIEHHLCPPGSPEKKPFVERLFGTFTRERAELLAGYAGHNVAEAQQLRGRAKKATGRAVVVPELTPDALQAIIDAWTDGTYHLRTHSSLKMSPRERWMSSPVAARAAPSEDVLKLALSARVGPLTVGKRGLIWKGKRYWSHALAAHLGRVVEVRRDEEDLGALFVFDEAGRFIDRAVNHERAGVSEQAFAEAARRAQAEHMTAARAEAREKARRVDFAGLRDALLDREAASAATVVSLPTRTAPFSTSMIDSVTARPLDLTPRTELDRIAAELNAAPDDGLSTVEQRVAHHEAVLARHAAGHLVTADALVAARSYVQSSEYRGVKQIQAWFAEPAGRRA